MNKKSNIKRIGIMTGGGDCPGLNPVIRAVTKMATKEYGWEVIGIRNGYKGLYENDWVKLEGDVTSGVLHKGGTILYSSN